MSVLALFARIVIAICLITRELCWRFVIGNNAVVNVDANGSSEWTG